MDTAYIYPASLHLRVAPGNQIHVRIVPLTYLLLLVLCPIKKSTKDVNKEDNNPLKAYCSENIRYVTDRDRVVDGHRWMSIFSKLYTEITLYLSHFFRTLSFLGERNTMDSNHDQRRSAIQNCHSICCNQIPFFPNIHQPWAPPDPEALRYCSTIQRDVSFHNRE